VTTAFVIDHTWQASDMDGITPLHLAGVMQRFPIYVLDSVLRTLILAVE